MIIPDLNDLEKVRDEARELVNKADSAVYSARNMQAYVDMFAPHFPKQPVLFHALAYIADQKTATLDEIVDYFSMSPDERHEVVKGIDFDPLNFIHTYHDKEGGTLFRFGCPRLWHEYSRGNKFFTREMLDAEMGIAKYDDEGDYQIAKCTICGYTNINADECDLCEHFDVLDPDKGIMRFKPVKS